MGQMHFVVPRRERVANGALQRAYLAGMEGIPWKGQNSWLTEESEQRGEFVVERTLNESGNLYFPWVIEGRGELTLATASLMERERPYNLPVELARGLLNRLRNQAADWQLAGLVIADDLKQRLKKASDCFISAVATGADEMHAADVAEQALELALDAGDLLAQEYSRQALAARHQQTAQLPTMLGSVLDGRSLSDDETATYLKALNTAAVAFRWRDIEHSAGKFDWQPFDDRIQWCHENGLRVIGGPLLNISTSHLPDWLYLWEDDFERLQSYIVQYLRSTIARYKGKVHIWNCAARMNVPGRLPLTEEQKLRLVVTSIEEVRRSDPSTPSIITFDQPWAEYLAIDDLDLSPLHFADSLVRADLGVSGIGLEINVGYWPGGTLPRDVIEFSRQLDRWSILNLPLVLFLTVPSGCGGDTPADEPRPLSRFASGPSPDAQRALAEQLVPLLMAKPYVQGLVWNQFFDTDEDDFVTGGLVDAAHDPKPVVEVLSTIREQHLM